MDIDWPLAIELVMVFVAFSVIRYSWFKRRMARIARQKAQQELNVKNVLKEKGMD